MYSEFLNKIIISHSDKTKLKDLYRNSAIDFFNYVLPSPVDLCNEESLLDTKYNIEEYGAETLREWRKKNWCTFDTPIPDSIKRKLANDGSFLEITFCTINWPAWGIYEELHRQGYFVRAYFWEPLATDFCGSYIYGVGEVCNHPNRKRFTNKREDIPVDLDRILQISAFWEGYDSEDGDCANSSYSEKDILEQKVSKEFYLDDMDYFKRLVEHKD